MDIQWYPRDRVAVSQGFYEDKPAFAFWCEREGIEVGPPVSTDRISGAVLLEWRRTGEARQ